MNKPFNPALSHSISELRFPLAALAVFGHANALSFPLTDIHSEYNIIQHLILLLSQIIFYSAVPLFFIISGILFFWSVDSYDHAACKSKMSKHVKTLLLPYLI
jgi:fucose 4-O-acetylase-like acetyltransferase